MNRFLSRVALTTCLLILFSVFNVTAQEKPLLSEEIARELETQGVAAAKQRFAEIYPSQKDTWELDQKGLTDLGMAYMQGGNMESGMAVIEMTTAINMAMVADAMNTYTPEIVQMQAAEEQAQRAAQEQQAKDREQELLTRQNSESSARGKVRDDLARFAGLYGDPGDGGRNRMIFVTVSCDGYLVSGALWADVGHWWMRSAADKVFTYADSFLNFSMEFGVDGSGKGSTLTHDIEGVASPMERLDDLPADWPECQERPKR